MVNPVYKMDRTRKEVGKAKVSSTTAPVKAKEVTRKPQTSRTNVPTTSTGPSQPQVRKVGGGMAAVTDPKQKLDSPANSTRSKTAKSGVPAPPNPPVRSLGLTGRAVSTLASKAKVKDTKDFAAASSKSVTMRRPANPSSAASSNTGSTQQPAVASERSKSTVKRQHAAPASSTSETTKASKNGDTAEQVSSTAKRVVDAFAQLRTPKDGVKSPASKSVGESSAVGGGVKNGPPEPPNKGEGLNAEQLALREQVLAVANTLQQSSREFAGLNNLVQATREIHAETLDDLHARIEALEAENDSLHKTILHVKMKAAEDNVISRRREEGLQRSLLDAQRREEETQRRLVDAQRREEETQRLLVDVRRREEETQRLLAAAQRREQNALRALEDARLDVKYQRDRAIEAEEDLMSKTLDIHERVCKWDTEERDYLLSIRCAERFRQEAEERAKELQQEKEKLERQLVAILNNNVVENGDSASRNTSPDISCTSGSEEGADQAIKEEGVLHRIISRVDVATSMSPAHLRHANANMPKEEIGASNGDSLRQGDGHSFSCGSVKENEKLKTLRKAAGGSLRNALLKWCQSRTSGYPNVDITNFSSSWKDGMALGALIHSLSPSAFEFTTISPTSPYENFMTAVAAAKTLGVQSDLDIENIISSENPSWENVLRYVSEVYTVAESP